MRVIRRTGRGLLQVSLNWEETMTERTSAGKSQITPTRILESVYAFREARVLLTAYELDLFTIIGDGSLPAAEIAAKAGTDPRATDRLLNALSASGYLIKADGRFSNTEQAAGFLVKGKPTYMGGLMHQADLWHTWTTLTEAVRKGTSVARHGSVNDRGAEWLDSFISAMHMRAIRQAPVIASQIDLDGVKRVLDVGGGPGTFSMAFVRAKDRTEAVVFDLPNVTPLTKEYVKNEDLSGRISTVDGDYTVDPLPGGFDLVFMSAVIHSNSPGTNGHLFRKAYDALNPGGRLVVLDFIMNDDRTGPEAGAYFALNMLVGTGEGDTFTEPEVGVWMKDAGFVNVTRTHTQFGTDLMTGTKNPR